MLSVSTLAVKRLKLSLANPESEDFKLPLPIERVESKPGSRVRFEDSSARLEKLCARAFDHSAQPEIRCLGDMTVTRREKRKKKKKPLIQGRGAQEINSLDWPLFTPTRKGDLFAEASLFCC